MTGEAEEFIYRGRVDRPNLRRYKPHLIEMDIQRDMFEDFAWAWCRENQLIDLINFKLRIVGYFSQRHPLDYKQQDITIFLERVH